MKTPSQLSTTTKPLLSRLVHNYVHSQAVVSIKLRGLTIRFRPMSYDAVALYPIMQIYGVVPEGYSAVDIGAHIGIFSLFATLFNARRVMAFEPERENYQLLKQNIDANLLSGKVQAFDLAIWSMDTKKSLFTSKGSAFHGFYPDARHIGGVETVSCKGINSVLDPLEGPIMLKVDAEGSEYEIIAAMNAENFHKVERIALEYHVGNAVLRSAFPSLIHLLQKRAFVVSLREDAHIISGIKKQIGIGAISE